jgi:hypothetical protein
MGQGTVTALGQRHLDGIGRQAGPLRPDYGPDWAELACDQCAATWVGRIGDPCDWCEKALERMQREKGIDPGPHDDYAGADPVSILLDWDTFWNHDRDEAEWLAEPVIPAKRSVAIFAPGGDGKSLFVLWLAVGLATGKRLLAPPTDPVNVLYIDYEMTEDDLAERLENMGYGPDSDLSHLHYALLPSLPGLDQPEGGKAVVELAREVDAQLVIIDTFGRAVHGDENDADTVRAWYRWTGLNLKAEGRAFVRIDHAGKDLDKGQRGTSAKNDDVDIVWRWTKQDGGTFKLVAKKRRMGWVPETVELVKNEYPVSYKILGGHTYPPGTRELAATLEELGVPVAANRKTNSEALKAAGKGARNALVGAAMRWRREEIPVFNATPNERTQPQHVVVEGSNLGPQNSGTRHQAVPGDQGAGLWGPTQETPAQSMGTTAGTNGDQQFVHVGTGPPLLEGTVPSTGPGTDQGNTDDEEDPWA